MITPERQAYHDARYRCNNPTNQRYPVYGGRGIEFRFVSFDQFIDALRTPENPSGLRPSPVHSLDRINTNGHYEQGNVRWATRDQQAASKRGETKVRKSRGVPWTPEQRRARALARMQYSKA
jgi:hypothetical protein